MIKLNRIRLAVIIFVIVGLLISGNYIISDNNKKLTDNKGLTAGMSENTTNSNSSEGNTNIKKYSGVLLNNITKNTKQVFNVGDKLVYEFPHIPPQNLMDNGIFFNSSSIKCILAYTVTDKIKVYETTYFKIQENALKCIIGSIEVGGVFKPIFRGSYTQTIYVDEDTGEIFIGVETGKKEKITDCYWSGCWYAQWMLKLDDHVAWQEEQVYSENEWIIYEFSVEGKEIINGRECFEVKKKWNECLNESCKITVRELYYIDVEKRITLRYYLWYEDLPVRETRLIDQNYFNKTSKPLLDDEIKINISEYNERMRLVNRVGYCEDNFCNPENNEIMESCCMDCGCSEGKVCNGVCMQDDGSALKFSSKEYGFNITLPSGWRGKWRGDSIFFELASEPWTSVEVFFGSLTGKTPQYAYYASDNLTAGSKNFTIIYSAPTKDDYENNLKLYEKIKDSFGSN